MNSVISSDKLYIAHSTIPNSGRGVFAKVAIKKGEVIERCPVIAIPEHDAEHVNHSILATYIYYLGKTKERLFLALGYGSLYNHTYEPNARYKEHAAEEIIEFIALRDIKPQEEITVNYNQHEQKNGKPLWFEV